MKLARLFCFLIILGSSAITAYAQTPLDPRVIVNDPAGCTIPPGISYNGPGPLVESYSSPECFTYTGAPNLTTLILQFTGVPVATPFACQTDIWVDCTISDLGGGITQFDLSGGPGACNFNDGIGGNCPGFLTTGQSATVTFEPVINETPELGSIVLFGTGLIAIFMGAKRRSHA